MRFISNFNFKKMINNKHQYCFALMLYCYWVKNIFDNNDEYLVAHLMMMMMMTVNSKIIAIEIINNPNKERESNQWRNMNAMKKIVGFEESWRERENGNSLFCFGYM